MRSLPILLLLLLSACGDMSNCCVSIDMHTYNRIRNRELLYTEDLVNRYRSTYYWAVREQTDSSPEITASNRNVNTFHHADTLYLAATQSSYHTLRSYRYCYTESGKPCLVVDKLNKRFNGKNIIDVLMPTGQKFPKDSLTIIFSNNCYRFYAL